MDSVLSTVRSTSDSFRTSASDYSSRAKKFAKEHSRVTVGATAVAAVATAGIAAGLSGGSTGTSTAGDATALNHGTVHTAQVQAGAAHANTVKASTDATKTTHTSTSVRGAHHAFTHVKLAIAEHRRPAAVKHSDPARHLAVVRHHQPMRLIPRPAIPDLRLDEAVRAPPRRSTSPPPTPRCYAAWAAQVAGHERVVWIDTTGHDPTASALDVEPGDATRRLAANWAYQRLSEHPHALGRDLHDAVGARQPCPGRGERTAAAHAGPRPLVDRRPDWLPRTSCPAPAPTQWYWGPSCDITTATPRF